MQRRDFPKSSSAVSGVLTMDAGTTHAAVRAHWTPMNASLASHLSIVSRALSI
jgi:hypothetical protein